MIDLFIVDVKVADPYSSCNRRVERAHPGQPQAACRRTSRDGPGSRPAPLVPRYTATPENLRAIADLIVGIDPALPVELMNFNPLAGAKYRRMGMVPRVRGCHDDLLTGGDDCIPVVLRRAWPRSSMSAAVRDFVDAAAAGRPVYISSCRERFEALPATASFTLTARVEGFDGEDRVFAFGDPAQVRRPCVSDERSMVIEYVLRVHLQYHLDGWRSKPRAVRGRRRRRGRGACSGRREQVRGRPVTAAAPRVRAGGQRLGADG